VHMMDHSSIDDVLCHRALSEENKDTTLMGPKQQATMASKNGHFIRIGNVRK
jgi:hypothetical protein